MSDQRDMVDLHSSMKGNFIAVAAVGVIQAGKSKRNQAKVTRALLFNVNTYIGVLKRTSYSNEQHISKLRRNMLMKGRIYV